jgi:hypothetical protein
VGDIWYSLRNGKPCFFCNRSEKSQASSQKIVRVIKSRRMKWAEHLTRMGEGRSIYRVSVGGTEGKRPPGRPRRRWEDDIKRDIREIGIDGRSGFGWLRIRSSGGLL